MKHHFKRQRVNVSDIIFDAGTQVRVAINEQSVADYAEHMTEGVEFPPVVLFHDGVRYYLADGFHRTLATKRNQFRDIDAEVSVGTRADALWFALGANKANGQRLTEADKTHAVRLALTAWPDRLHKEIALQVGCSTSLISKVSSKLNGESGEKTGKALADQRKREAVVAAIEAGERDAERIAHKAGVSKSFVSKVRAEAGLQCFDRTKAGAVKRRADIRRMAEQGYTTRQIAGAVGIGTDRVSAIAKEDGIDVHADSVVGKIKRHDSTRIMAQIVEDAANLLEGSELIQFGDLNPTEFAGWLTSLNDSRDRLGMFIRRVMKERQKHGEAA